MLLEVQEALAVLDASDSYTGPSVLYASPLRVQSIHAPSAPL